MSTVTGYRSSWGEIDKLHDWLTDDNARSKQQKQPSSGGGSSSSSSSRSKSFISASPSSADSAGRRVAFADGSASKAGGSSPLMSADALATDVESFGAHVRHVESLVLQIGTSNKDQSKIREKVQEARRHCDREAERLKTALERALQEGNYGSSGRVAAAAVQSPGSSEVRMRYKRIANDFLRILDEYRQVYSVQLAREKAGPAAHQQNQQQRGRISASAAAGHSDAAPGSPSNEAELLDMSSSDDKRSLLYAESPVESKQEQLQLQQQQQQARLVDWQASTLEVEHKIALERHSQARSLESDLHDLNSIFTEFAVLVDQQDEKLDIVGANVLDAKRDVERGVEEIQVARRLYSGYSKRLWITAGVAVVIVILIFLMVILGTVLPK